MSSTVYQRVFLGPSVARSFTAVSLAACGGRVGS